MTDAPRPKSVTLIGWYWMLLGAFITLNGAYTLGVVSRLGPMAEGTPLIIRMLPIISGVQVLIGVITVVSARGFLWCVPWTRRALQILSVAGLLYLMVVAGFYIRSLLNSEVPVSVNEANVIQLVVLALSLGIVLWFLRSETVKKALE
jgi:hypothetical protein